jgi:hypothetical protein
LIRCKLCNNGEGRSYVVDDLVNDAIAAHLIDDPIPSRLSKVPIPKSP